MEDDLALRYVRIYQGVNSRAELITLAQRFAQLAWELLYSLEIIQSCGSTFWKVYQIRFLIEIWSCKQ